MTTNERPNNLELVYTICCDDVRLEVGSKLSLMGVFHQLVVQQFPVSLMKFAVVSQWRGEGAHLSEVRILTDDRRRPIVVAEPARFEVQPGGVANISFFFNVVFPEPGNYWVQTLVNSTLFDERPLALILAQDPPRLDNASEAIN
jgi:hypothetical protein